MNTSWNTDPIVTDRIGQGAPSYRLEVLAQGERNFASNGMRFPSIETAAAYASDLTSRWFAVTAWRICDCFDAPNQLTLEEREAARKAVPPDVDQDEDGHVIRIRR